jgi:hypothetical protein
MAGKVAQEKTAVHQCGAAQQSRFLVRKNNFAQGIHHPMDLQNFLICVCTSKGDHQHAPGLPLVHIKIGTAGCTCNVDRKAAPPTMGRSLLGDCKSWDCTAATAAPKKRNRRIILKGTGEYRAHCLCHVPAPFLGYVSKGSDCRRPLRIRLCPPEHLCRPMLTPCYGVWYSMI